MRDRIGRVVQKMLFTWLYKSLYDLFLPCGKPYGTIRQSPMAKGIYHSQTSCRISIEQLAMRKGSLICVPSLRRFYLPGASFKLGFKSVSPRSTAKLSFHFRHYGQTSFRILLCVCIFTPLLPQKHGQTSFRIRPIFSSTRTCKQKVVDL
jgi:hypothetical protein